MSTTNVNTQPAPGAIAAPAPGEAGKTDAQGLSVAQLARQISGARPEAEEKKKTDAADPATNGGHEPEAAAAAKVLKDEPGAQTPGTDEAKHATALTTELQTLKLNPEALAAVTKAFAEGGDIDAGKLGLTDEQTAGLQRIAEQQGGDQAAPEAAPEAEAELDLSKTKFSPEQKASINGMFKDRIGKVIGRERDAAKAKITAAETAKVAAEQQAQELRTKLEAKPQIAAASVPLGDVTTQEQLAKRAADAKDVKTWATQNLNRLNRAPEAVEAELKKAGITLPEFSVDAMETYLTDAQTYADKTLSDDVPARAQYLKDEVAGNQKAAQLFPNLEKTDTEFGKDANTILREFPEIKRKPHWKMILGVIATGIQTMRERDAAAAKAPTAGAKKINILPRAKVPKVNVRPGGAPRSTTAGEAAETQAEAQFKSSGSTADLAKMFGSRRK